MKSCLAVAAAVCAFALSSSEARAQLIAGPFGGHHHHGGGWGLNRGFLNVGAPNPGQMYGFAFPSANLQDRMPHFSLFPPVYYGYPMPRPYGYSPFAYPGFVETPQASFAEPLTMANPFSVEGSRAEPAPKAPAATLPTIAPSTNRTSRVEPSRKLNPFFDDPIVVRERR